MIAGQRAARAGPSSRSSLRPCARPQGSTTTWVAPTPTSSTPTVERAPARGGRPLPRRGDRVLRRARSLLATASICAPGALASSSNSGRWIRRSRGDRGGARSAQRPSPPTQIVVLTCVSGLLADRRGDARRVPARSSTRRFALARSDPRAPAPRAGRRCPRRRGMASAARCPRSTGASAAAVDARRGARRPPWTLGELTLWRHRAGLEVTDRPRGGAVRGRARGRLAPRAQRCCGPSSAAPMTRRSRWLQSERRTGATSSPRASYSGWGPSLLPRSSPVACVDAASLDMSRAAKTAPPRPTPASLTDTRARGARLARRRACATADIAERLVVSSRTVEHHVSAILGQARRPHPGRGGRRRRAPGADPTPRKPGPNMGGLPHVLGAARRHSPSSVLRDERSNLWAQTGRS